MADVMQKESRVLLPMLALRGLVLFPQMVLHFDVGREKSLQALNDAMSNDRMIFLVAQKDIRTEDPAVSDLYQIGVVAKIKQIIKPSQGGPVRVLVEGRYRARMAECLRSDPYFYVEAERMELKAMPVKKSMMAAALMRTIKELFEQYCSLTPRMPRELVVNAMGSDDPVYLVEYIASQMTIPPEDKQAILEESRPIERLERMAKILEHENSILTLEQEIQERVREQVDKNQREYYLREQMRAISVELGEEDVVTEAADYREKIEALHAVDEVKEKLLKEVDRLVKLPSSSHESGVIRGYLDSCLELPWGIYTKEKIDIKAAKRQLDADHYGLEKIKDRILESIAVRKLAPEMKGQILCFVGPPGVGKTSIAKSIAKALGRKYARMSLGGVRDESDIRGHRKTYIGAMPGRIINAIKLAGSSNPLILLDEVDKLGSDYRGDPSSALLEVLDSEQNYAFRDHYIEVPYDLSQVLFIATANDRDTIPAPLLDRMEIIELGSYTREEKFQIAKRHLLKKQMQRHGLNGRMLHVKDEALYTLIDNYTREAGVRRLERSIASLCRKAAKAIAAGDAKQVTVTAQTVEEYLGPKKYLPELIFAEDQVGVVNGLAWTSVGGELLQVEVAVLDGSGKLELTGSLGDVMKESAHAAVSYVRSCTEQYGIEKDFYKTKDIHIHVPEGAVPKDGPSAGVTICTALVSALSGIPVRRDIAMTGEITLRGRVLPIGGLKEKTMAAYRAGVKTVMIPFLNRADLYEVDPVVKEHIEFIPAEHVSTILDHALVRQPQPLEAAALPAGGLGAPAASEAVRQ